LTVPRIYCTPKLKDNSYIELEQESLRYVKSVLRMKKGDRLILFDGTGWEYEAVVKQVSKDSVVVKSGKGFAPRDREISLTLIQSLPKANMMDFIVHKATELGADRIIPFRSSRSVPRLSPEKIRAKMTRWQNIAVQSARQCGRNDIPELIGVLSFEEAVTWPASGNLKIIFWEEETEMGIKQLLGDAQLDGQRDIAIIVGPEGGFSKEEVAKAKEKGFVSVSLGRQVLKVDTAVLTILSIIQYEKGMFKGTEKKEFQ